MERKDRSTSSHRKGRGIVEMAGAGLQSSHAAERMERHSPNRRAWFPPHATLDRVRRFGAVQPAPKPGCHLRFTFQKKAAGGIASTRRLAGQPFPYSGASP